MNKYEVFHDYFKKDFTQDAITTITFIISFWDFGSKFFCLITLYRSFRIQEYFDSINDRYYLTYKFKTAMALLRILFY